MADEKEVEILDETQKAALSLQKVKDMIDALSLTEDGESLKSAMRDLKKALLENPTACAMLLPEDVGKMVEYLMKVTGRDLMAQTSEAGKKKAKKEASKIDFSDPATLAQLEKDLF